jgi:hypothetical protein
MGGDGEVAQNRRIYADGEGAVTSAAPARSKVITRLRRARRMASRLSVRDLRVLVEAISLIPWIEIRLRTLAFDRLLARAGREGRSRRPRTALDIDRAARLIEALFACYPFNPTCLKQSLVLLRLVRRRGIPAQLRIGVRKDAGELIAHAWIECGGRTLLPGDGIERYQTLPPIPGGRGEWPPRVRASDFVA